MRELFTPEQRQVMRQLLWGMHRKRGDFSPPGV